MSSKFKKAYDLVLESLASSNIGKGWFINTRNGKTASIDSGNLGENGDHDGWIAISDNAKSLGLDLKKAKSWQESHYGFEVPMDHPLAGSEGSLKFPNSYYIDGMAGAGGTIPDGVDTDAYNKYFMDKYGKNAEDAYGYDDWIKDLVRVRLWNDGLLSITSRGNARDLISVIPAIVKLLGKDIDKVVKVTASAEADEIYTSAIDKKDFLLIRNVRDLKVYN